VATGLQAAFERLVTTYADRIGRANADMILENAAHGEIVISFETLVDSLQEVDVQVTEADKRDLQALAEALDRTTYPSGEGLYW